MSIEEPNNSGHTIGFLSNTDHELDDIHVFYEDMHVAGPAGISPRDFASIGMVKTSIPERARLTWVDLTDGRHREQTIDLRSNVPEGFSAGTIYYIFDRNGAIRVRAARNEDEESHVAIRKSIDPQAKGTK